MKNNAVIFLEYSIIFSIALLILSIGAAVISVNCHNAMNSHQITLFDAYRIENGVTVIFMDKQYRFGAENAESSENE